MATVRNNTFTQTHRHTATDTPTDQDMTTPLNEP